MLAILSPAEMALMIPILGVSIPIIAIITSHQRKMAEIRANQDKRPSAQMEAELAALRREVAELRDVATNYDLSFDAALSRLEQRVERIEQGEPRAVDTAYSSRDYTTQTEQKIQTPGR